MTCEHTIPLPNLVKRNSVLTKRAGYTSKRTSPLSKKPAITTKRQGVLSNMCLDFVFKETQNNFVLMTQGGNEIILNVQ